ncbi:MAG: hypothetical protein AAF126_21790 [Chloroflexota bacterium]
MKAYDESEMTDLQAMADDIVPRPEFAQALENRLRQVHAEQQAPMRKTPTFPRWQAIAASVVLVCVLIAMLPPTRAFAVQMMSVFFRSDSDTITVAPSNGFSLNTVQVNTIEEAEAIANFEATQWYDEGYFLRFIFAADGHINLVYEQAGDGVGSLVHISQTRRELVDGSAFDAVPPDVDITSVTVNDYVGEYVEGYWFSFAEDGNTTFRWDDNHFRQLQWTDDTYSYRLMIASDVVQNADEAVALAESLR